MALSLQYSHSKVWNSWSNVNFYFFKLNGYIYSGIHLKRGVLKTMPKRPQIQELRGEIIVRNVIFLMGYDSVVH